MDGGAQCPWSQSRTRLSDSTFFLSWSIMTGALTWGEEERQKRSPCDVTKEWLEWWVCQARGLKDYQEPVEPKRKPLNMWTKNTSCHISKPRMFSHQPLWPPWTVSPQIAQVGTKGIPTVKPLDTVANTRGASWGGKRWERTGSWP